MADGVVESSTDDSNADAESSTSDSVVDLSKSSNSGMAACNILEACLLN